MQFSCSIQPRTSEVWVRGNVIFIRMVVMSLSCSLLDGCAETFLVLCKNVLCKIHTTLVAIILLSGPPDFLVVPSGLYQLQAHLLWVVCAPTLLAEAAKFLGSVDQHPAFILWNTGVDQLHLPFCSIPFCFGIASTLIYMFLKTNKRALVFSGVDWLTKLHCFCHLIGHMCNRNVARSESSRGSTGIVALLALGL